MQRRKFYAGAVIWNANWDRFRRHKAVLARAEYYSYWQKIFELYAFALNGQAVLTKIADATEMTLAGLSAVYSYKFAT